VDEFRITTSQKTQVVDITERVAAIVRQVGASQGLCCVYVPHATAAIVINENADPQIGDDLLEALDRLVPQGVWRHDRIDANGAAHIKAAILGPSETIPVAQGKLRLGTWQSVLLVELDGPRERRVLVGVR
jgi:secondary thiamine-phosphate synthase enzyme